MSAETGITMTVELSAEQLDLLAEKLAPRLGADATPSPEPIAYTVATLARALELSERAIRAAILRGELQAVKRGRSYLISRAAVEAWAAPARRPPRDRERSTRGRPRRSVMASALAGLDRGR